jgi:hypothetical protein
MVTAAELQPRRQTTRTPGNRDDADQEDRAARWRRTLPLLWLAGLVAWGVLSYATAGLSGSSQTGTSAQEEVPHGPDGVLDARSRTPGIDSLADPRETSVHSSDWHPALQVQLGPIGPTPGQGLRRQ